LNNYAAVLIDLNRGDLINAIENQAWSDTLNKAAPLVASYLEDAVNFNACFDGANRLVEMLGTETKETTYQSGGGRRDAYPLMQQAQRATTLIQHLAAASQAAVPTIFRIHLGGHGFTLIVKGETVYKLETLAGASFIGTLLNSIITGKNPGAEYPIDQISRNVRRMVSDNPALRTQGADEMGWNAGPIGILSSSADSDEYDIIQDPMTLYWTASNLASKAEIIDRFANKIQANRQAILKGIE
jgi:hypothetical protein